MENRVRRKKCVNGLWDEENGGWAVCGEVWNGVRMMENKRENMGTRSWGTENGAYRRTPSWKAW